jgi:hypothetical protein
MEMIVCLLWLLLLLIANFANGGGETCGWRQLEVEVEMT